MYNLTIDFLKRASERSGFSRERFEEKNIPSDVSSIAVLPFFGDFRTLLFLGGTFFHRYRQESKNSKYFIVASWPGFQGVFPYADEYWGINDYAHLKQFYEGAEGVQNKSSYTTAFYRCLNEYFRDIVTQKEIFSFYKNGLTDEFFSKYQDTKIFLPFVPSGSILGQDFNKQLMTKPGYKIFIWPSFFGKRWHLGENRNIKISYEFWSSLIDFLLKSNFHPVVWKNSFSHDMSREFAGQCTFLNQPDISKVLSAMRSTGCVLDIFNCLSRFAFYARCPFLCVDERSRYLNTKEDEFNNLFGFNLPQKYIFSFSTIITEGNFKNWTQDLFPSIVMKLNDFIPELNRDDWPSTGEFSKILPYKNFVRKKTYKKIGTRFIKVPKLE